MHIFCMYIVCVKQVQLMCTSVYKEKELVKRFEQLKQMIATQYLHLK